jgi:RNA polymerase sigma factor (sigma-70 family)
VNTRDFINKPVPPAGRAPAGDLSDDPDAALIQSVGAGDHAAFEHLYKRYYPYLFRFILRTTRCLEGIEEIINDVMLVVWRSAANLELTSRTSTWILGIAYRKALKSISRSRRSREMLPIEGVEYDLPRDSKTAMEHLELSDLLTVALQSMSPEHSAVIELAYYHGMHYAEIAEVMDCPEATVKTRMFYARKKLRSVLPGLMGETSSVNSVTGGGLPS